MVSSVLGCLVGTSPSSAQSSSAAQQVCNDRTQLNSAVSTVADDLHSRNFSKAKNDLPAVKDAVNSLVTSAKNLKSQTAQKLDSKIDHLKSTVEQLKDSRSLRGLRTSFASFKSQDHSISNQIGDDLKCS
jgi:hypothetical protein